MENSFTPRKWRRAPEFLWFLFGCFLSSIFSISSAQAQLSGTYTIGGADGDFASFTEAVKAIEAQGKTGTVTFKVRPGTYTEQLNSSSIAGVAFEGETTDSTDVVLQYDNDPVVMIGGGTTLRYLTISGTGDQIVSISNNSSHITLEGNVIKGSEGSVLVSSNSTDEREANFHTYRNN